MNARWPSWCLALMTSTTFSLTSHAAPPRPQVDRVNPALFLPLGAPHDLIGVGTTRTLPHLGFFGAFTVHLADDELVMHVPGEPPTELLDRRLTGVLGLGLGLWDLLEVQAALPVLLTEEQLDTDSDAWDLGDLRLALQARLLGPRPRAAGWGLAVRAEVTLPTSGNTAFSGEKAIRFESQLLGDYRFDSGAVISVKAGFLLRKSTRIMDLAVGHELRFGAGGEVPLLPQTSALPVSLLAELEGALGFGSAPFDPDAGLASRKIPLEGRVGFRVRPGAWAITAASGFGLTSGYGAPDYRVMIGVSWQSPAPPPHLSPRTEPDAPPDAASNNPSPLAPSEDTPPQSPPALSDPQQLQGAAHDAAFDAAVAADPDPDGDGVLGEADKCPHDPEDFDGFEDEDGCPDPDNDGDGIPDASDRCPNEPETINGINDEDGCPDEGQGVVAASREHFELKGIIEFESGSDRLKESTNPLLDQLASQLKANAWVRRIRIEGHTDGQGNAEQNVDLSERRAARVRAELVTRGVALERLLARGFGATRPVATNANEAGRKQNRRVEFRIIDPAPAGSPRIEGVPDTSPEPGVRPQEKLP